MDDICDSVNTAKEAKELSEDLDQVLKKGGFKVKGWTSNKNLGNSEQDESKQEIQMFQNKEEKVLGVAWNCKTDHLSVKVTQQLDGKFTKRKLLSQVASNYNPIGVTAAFTIRCKIALQELWQIGVNWDEELPIKIAEKWKQLFNEMNNINDISIPHSLLTTDAADDAPTLCILQMLQKRHLALAHTFGRRSKTIRSK